MSPHLKGVFYTALGVLIITPDALLLRLIEADTWTVLFWRGLGFFSVQWLIVTARYGRQSFDALRHTGWLGFGIALTMATTQLLFVGSIMNTYVANTLVIIAASPLLAAALAYLALGEKVAPRTLATGVIALLAVGLTMSGGFILGNFVGDMAAVGATIAIALLFTLLRAAKDRDMLPAISLGGLVVAATALAFATTIVPPITDLPWLLILCLFVSPISFALMSIGPRYLPASEVNLLLLLETALGPLWVWLVLAEVPPNLTLIGGAMLLTAITVNAAIGLRTERAATAVGP